MMSLFGTVVEVGVRVLFYNLYVKAGIGINQKGEKAKADYLKRGKLRVMDGTNDMMVEYTSAITSASMLVFLPSTGSFNFTSGTVNAAQVWTVLMYQLSPEIFLDWYCSFIETHGGLGRFHLDYWKLHNGGRNGSRYGHLVKSVIAKVFQTNFVTGLVLMLAMRAK